MIISRLELHWRDIIELLGAHNECGGPRHLNPDTFRIICVDVNFVEEGAVEGEGAFPVYIARQNLNHFVPLLRFRGSGGTRCNSSRSASSSRWPGVGFPRHRYQNLS